MQFSKYHQCRHLIRYSVLVVALLTTACGTYSQNHQRHTAGRTASGASPDAVAVLGVMAADRELGSGSRVRLAQLLEQQINEHANFQYLPNGIVTEVVGSAVLADTLHRYRLSQQLDVSRLVALDQLQLPIRYGLLARIDKNETVRTGPVLAEVRNRYGDIVADRFEVRLSHERHLVASMELFDLVTGRSVWSRSFESRPIRKNTYTEYAGSSFMGSVAATVANSFANGSSEVEHPPAPSERETLNKTFAGLVKALVQDRK